MQFIGKAYSLKPTGKGGGRNAILTEADNLVLDIIGSDSPAVIGLKVRESRIETVEFDEVMKDDADTSVGGVNIASHVVASSRDGFSGSIMAGVGVKSATIARARIAGASVGYSNLAGVKLAGASIGGAGVASAAVPNAGVASAAVPNAGVAGAAVPGGDVPGATISSIGVAGAALSSVGVEKASVSCTRVGGAGVSSERVGYLCGSSGSRTLFGQTIKPVRKRQAQKMIGSFSDNREDVSHKKRELKIENFELSNYKLKLEIRKLELELGYTLQIQLTYKGIIS